MRQSVPLSSCALALSRFLSSLTITLISLPLSLSLLFAGVGHIRAWTLRTGEEAGEEVGEEEEAGEEEAGQKRGEEKRKKKKMKER